MEKTINDLPIYVWPTIFKYLSIKDLFNCRLVNKKFKDFSDFTDGISKLALTKEDVRYNYASQSLNQISNKEFIEEESVISVLCYRRMRSFFFKLDQTLKYLIINDIDFSLSELPNLINLEYLKVNFCSNKNQLINLNSLRFLILSNHVNNIHFYLDTPKLEKLIINNMDQLHFNSKPESIKHLVIEEPYTDRLKIFKNLEFIKLNLDDSRLDKDLLLYFKNLKKLIFQFKSSLYNYGDQHKDNLKNLLEYKLKFKSNIDIYFQDVKIDNIEQLNNISSCTNWLQFHIENIDALDSDLNQIEGIWYIFLDKLFNDFRNELPSAFFNKYGNVQRIIISSSIRNADNFYWYLKNLKSSFIDLYINLLNTEQSLFDNLPNVITKLTISCLNINCNFIYKLTKLKFLHFKMDGDFDFALNLFSKLKNLQLFIFYFQLNEIKIFKFNHEFKLILDDQVLYKKLTYNELIDKCQIISYSLKKDKN